MHDGGRATLRRAASAYHELERRVGLAADKFQADVLRSGGFAESESLLISARVPYVALLRLSSIVYSHTYGTLGLSRRGRNLVRAATALSVASTVREVMHLRRSPRRYATSRLLRDTAETGLYAALSPNYTAVSVGGAPLADRTWVPHREMVWPLLLPHAAIATVARRLTHRSPQLDHLSFLGIAATGGGESGGSRSSGSRTTSATGRMLPRPRAISGLRGWPPVSCV